MRVQRTRSSPSALRSPLTRCPLGSGRLGMVLVTTMLGLACSNDMPTAHERQQSPRPAEVRVLSSGRRIEVTSIDHSPSQLGPTLAFHYSSKANPGDILGLRREVDDIWTDLQKQADQEGVAAVLIVPALNDGTGTGFVLRRNADGTWRKSSGLWAR
jgi:hypothetical protein